MYYEKTFYDQADDDIKYMNQVKIEQIKYTVMRLGFINPIYLPPLNECFLRKDFNFAKYLGYAYGKTLTHFFNTTCGSIILLLIVLDLFKLTELSKD